MTETIPADKQSERKRMPASERKAEIAAAARDLFLEEGLVGARTKNLAERAGTTEAVLYQHFSSKEQLFELTILAPLAEGLDLLADRTVEVLSSDTPLEQRIAEFERLWLDEIGRLVPFLGVALFSDLKTGRSSYERLVVPFLDRVEGGLADAGLIRPDRVRGDAWTVGRALFGMNFFLQLDRLGRKRKVDPKLLVGQISDVLFFGLSGGQSLRRLDS